MLLLVSEICRLILGFLEDEKFPKTYETFLDECKYLEECRIYIEKGLSFPKKIHGKDLIEYLNLNTTHIKSYSSVFCQTIKKSTFSSGTQTTKSSSKLNQIVSCEVSTQTDSFENSKLSSNLESNKKNSQFRSKYKKRQNSFIQRKNQNQNVSHSANLDDSLDLDNFIQNLCQNDFAQKLAERINEVNAKKSNLSLDSSMIETTQNKCEQLPMNEITIENKNFENAHISSQIISNQNEQQQNNFVTQDAISYSMNDLIPTDDSKIVIDEQDISLLAEHFSEPAFEALFELINSHNPNEVVPICTESNVLIEQKNQVVNMNENLNVLTTNTNNNNTTSEASTSLIEYSTQIDSLDLIKTNETNQFLIETKDTTDEIVTTSQREEPPKVEIMNKSIEEIKNEITNSNNVKEDEKTNETVLEFRFSDEEMTTSPDVNKSVNTTTRINLETQKTVSTNLNETLKDEEIKKREILSNDDFELSLNSNKIEQEQELEINQTSTQNSETINQLNDIDSDEIFENAKEEETLVLEDDEEEDSQTPKSISFEPYDEDHHEKIKSACEILNVFKIIDQKKDIETKIPKVIKSSSDDEASNSSSKSKKFEQPSYLRGETGSFIIIGRTQHDVFSIEKQLKSINKLNELSNSNSINTTEEKSDSLSGIESISLKSTNLIEKLENEPTPIVEDDSNSSSSYSIPPTPFLKQNINTGDDVLLNDVDENLIVDSDLNLSSNAMSPHYSSQQPPKTPPQPNENSKSNLNSARTFKKAVSFQCSFKDIFTNKFDSTKLILNEDKLNELDELEIKSKNDETILQSETKTIILKETNTNEPLPIIESQNNVNNQIENETTNEKPNEKAIVEPSLDLNLNDCFEAFVDSNLLNEEKANTTTVSNNKNEDKLTSTPTKEKDESTKSPNEIVNTIQEEILSLSQSLSYSSSSSTRTTPNRTPKTPKTPNSTSKKNISNNSTHNPSNLPKEKELNIDEILKLVKPTSLITSNTPSINNTNNYYNINTSNHVVKNDQRNMVKPPTIREIFDSKANTESIIRSSSSSVVYRPENKEPKRYESSEYKKSDSRSDSKYKNYSSSSSSSREKHKLSGCELKRKREYFDDFMSEEYESNKRALKSQNSNYNNHRRSNSKDRVSSTTTSSAPKYDRYDKRYNSYSSSSSSSSKRYNSDKR